MFLLVLALALPVRAQPTAGDSPEILLAVGRVDSLLQGGHLAESLELARRLDKQYGDHPRHAGQIAARLGLSLLRSGQPGEALEFLEKSVRLEPTRPEYHRNLGNALLQLGRRGRALSEYAQAVELAPRELAYQLEYGQLLLDFGDHARAGTHLLTARRLCGDCPEVQVPLARYYLKAQLYAQAVEILSALPAQNESTAVRRSLIQALQGAGQDSLLVEILAGEGLSGLPVDEAMVLVEAEGRLGDPQWSRIFAVSPGQVPHSVLSHGQFWGKVSYNLLLAGLDQAALLAADRAIRISPDNVVYRNNRVVLLTRMGRHEEAAEEWERVLELDPRLKEQNRQ